MGAESERICCSAPEKGEEELITTGGHRVDGLRFSLCAQTTLAESSLGSAWGRCELKERLKVMGVQQGGCKHGYTIGRDEAKIANYGAVG